MNVWHERKEKWNQTVEKGVKYDNTADSLSLVSAILISRHNFRYCSIYFVVRHYDWNLFGSVELKQKADRAFYEHEIEIYTVFSSLLFSEHFAWM
jgi:hypothetical protein